MSKILPCVWVIARLHTQVGESPETLVCTSISVSGFLSIPVDIIVRMSTYDRYGMHVQQLSDKGSP